MPVAVENCDSFRLWKFACDTTYCMKAARFFPLAYLANVHGFILLAPYLLLFLTISRTLQIYRKVG